ncbi:hypothetical protein Tco_1544932 [Tanacetum coccineum]
MDGELKKKFKDAGKKKLPIKFEASQKAWARAFAASQDKLSGLCQHLIAAIVRVTQPAPLYTRQFVGNEVTNAREARRRCNCDLCLHLILKNWKCGKTENLENMLRKWVENTRENVQNQDAVEIGAVPFRDYI